MRNYSNVLNLNNSMLFQGECDPAFGAEFKFSIHEKELVIGEVFVRIYNEQPNFQLEVRMLWNC